LLPKFVFTRTVTVVVAWRRRTMHELDDTLLDVEC
jgi:hypothetical protein